MLHGGLPNASATMLVGPSGVGKTTLGLHFLSQASTEQPGLYFGFAEPPALILAKCRALSLPLTSLVESGTVEFLWQPAAEGLIDELGKRLLDHVRRRGVKLVFTDGFNSFNQAAAEPERTPYVFTAVVNEFRALGVTSVYTAESEELLGIEPRPPRMAAKLGFGLSTIAENILMMRFLELGSKLHRLVSIAKVRDDNFDPEIREFVIGKSGMEVDENSAAAEAILGAMRGQRLRRKPGSA